MIFKLELGSLVFVVNNTYFQFNTLFSSSRVVHQRSAWLMSNHLARLCTQGSPERFLRLTQKIPISLSGAKVSIVMQPNWRWSQEKTITVAAVAHHGFWSCCQVWKIRLNQVKQRTRSVLCCMCVSIPQRHKVLCFDLPTKINNKEFQLVSEESKIICM